MIKEGVLNSNDFVNHHHFQPESEIYDDESYFEECEEEEIDEDYYCEDSEPDDTYYDSDDYDPYYEERTYERYNGSYAQDVEGWSDQDIDDVFDGDPDAYWNID